MEANPSLLSNNLFYKTLLDYIKTGMFRLSKVKKEIVLIDFQGAQILFQFTKTGYNATRGGMIVRNAGGFVSAREANIELMSDIKKLASI